MSITIGPFAFATAHLVFILASMTTLALAWWLGRRLQLSLSDAAFRIIAVGLISARVIFVIKYVDAYLSAPWQIINVRDGGFSLWAGLLAGAAWTGWEILRMRAAQLGKEAEQPSPDPAIKQAPARLVMALGIGLTLAFAGHTWLNHQLSQTQFPQLSLQPLQGPPVNMAEQFYGQPTVINLWASWCPPCVREMPLLEDAAEAWPDVQIVAINQGESREEVMLFLREQQLSLPLVLLDQQSELGNLMGSHALPTTLFFHSDGSLSYTHIGEFSAATLQNAIRRLE